MKAIRFLITVSFLIISTTTIAQDTLKAISIANNLDYTYFFKHLKYFASDELEGRAVASAGFQKAAVYTANEFKNIGLLPFGDNNTYFQIVPLEKVKISASSFSLSIENKEEKLNGLYGENITVMLNPGAEQIQSELVFAGYGNVLPDKNIDDYKGIDAEGKIVIIASGAPTGLEDSRLQSISMKAAMARSKGAIGIIMFIPAAEAEQDVNFTKFHDYMCKPAMLISDGRPFSPLIDMPFVSYAKMDFVSTILAFNKLDIKIQLQAMTEGKFVSRELNSKIRFSYKPTTESYDCKNIVALLPGTDPVLKDEYVVIGAHLDHLGIGKVAKGDSIYNGMCDNASGTAAVLSIANEFQTAGLKSKRSILFICYTAEEVGLLGSGYFAGSPLIKDKKLVANVNIDILGGIFETTDLRPLGYLQSNLSEAVDFAARALNISITDPSGLENEYLERSDLISFIKTAVPAVDLQIGTESNDPAFNIDEAIEQWLNNIYHSPFDDLKQGYSDKGFHTFIKLNFLLTYYIANEMDEVKWCKDGWVYKKYVETKK